MDELVEVAPAPAPARRRSRVRVAFAAFTGVAVWGLLVWLASLLVTIPTAAFVFVLVFVITLMVAGAFLPLSGFGTASAALWIATIVAGVVAIGVMNAHVWPLLLGVVVLFVAVTPALMAALFLLGEEG